MDFPELISQTRMLWYTNNPILTALALKNLVEFLHANPDVCARDGRRVDVDENGVMVSNLRNFIIGLTEEAYLAEHSQETRQFASTLYHMLGF